MCTRWNEVACICGAGEDAGLVVFFWDSCGCGLMIWREDEVAGDLFLDCGMIIIGTGILDVLMGAGGLKSRVMLRLEPQVGVTL